MSATPPDGGHVMDGGLDYVGVRPCGCVTAWMAAEGSSEAEVLKFYASMANTGRAVQFMSLEDARASLSLSCPHDLGRVMGSTKASAA